MTIKIEMVTAATPDTVAICFIVNERLTRKLFSESLDAATVGQQNCPEYILWWPLVKHRDPLTC